MNPAEQGREAFRAGRYDEAATSLAQALAATPADAALELMLARSRELAGDRHAARTHFAHVAQAARDPQHRELATRALESLLPNAEGHHDRLAQVGLCPPERWDSIQSGRRLDETPLEALLRSEIVTWTQLVGLVQGKGEWATRGDRRYGERLGSTLVKAGLVTQFQLKQALTDQPMLRLPLGRILADRFSVPQVRIDAEAARLVPWHPRLAAKDDPVTLLHAWGLLDVRQQTLLRRAAPAARSEMLRSFRVPPEALSRAQQYQRYKVETLVQHQARLGEILVEQGRLSMLQLARCLASQVDQPVPLGELLIRLRACDPEHVLDALVEQQRRYSTLAAEGLPPLPDLLPPLAEVIPEPMPPAPITSRRNLAIAAAVALLLGYAAWYGTRYTGVDYSWLAAFLRLKPHVERHARDSHGALVNGSQQEGGPAGPASQFDALSAPRSPSDLSPPPAGPQGSEWEGTGSAAIAGTPPGSELGQAMPSKPGDLTPEGRDARFGGTGMDGDRVAYPMQAPEGGRALSSEHTPYPSSGPANEPRPLPTPPAAQASVDRLRTTPEGQPMRGQEGMHAVPVPPRLPGPAGRPQANGTLTGERPDAATVARSGSIFRYQLGIGHYNRQEWNSAEAEFRASRTADPTNPMPLYYLGRLAERRGEGARAWQFYQDYLAVAPDGEFNQEAKDRSRQLGPQGVSNPR